MSSPANHIPASGQHHYAAPAHHLPSSRPFVEEQSTQELSELSREEHRMRLLRLDDGMMSTLNRRAERAIAHRDKQPTNFVAASVADSTSTSTAPSLESALHPSISPPVTAQRQCDECAAEQDVEKQPPELQHKAFVSGDAPPESPSMIPKTSGRRQDTGTPAEATADVEQRIQQSRGQGQPLGEAIRAPMEQAFGADFSGVRIHTDGESHELNRAVQAKAFTTGQDIYFRRGGYEPGNRNGQELLAHELTHVVQQGGAGHPIQRVCGVDECCPEEATPGADESTAAGMTSVDAPMSMTVPAPEDSRQSHMAEPQAGMTSADAPMSVPVPVVTSEPEDNEFDNLVQAELEGFLAEFSAIPVTVRWVEQTDTQCVPREAEVAVHPPYFMNVTQGSRPTAAARTVERYDTATGNRGDADRDPRRYLREVRTREDRGGMGMSSALVGKSSPEEIQTILQMAIDRHLIPTPAGQDHLTGADLRNWLVQYGIGVDCSAFVAQALNRVMEQVYGRPLTDEETLRRSGRGTRNARSMTGDARGFSEVEADELRPGDTMGIPGHIRIVTSVRQDDEGNTIFTTAEARAGGQDDVGPDRAEWRYRNGQLQMRRSPEADWSDVDEAPTFGRYDRLADAEATQAEEEAATDASSASGPTTEISIQRQATDSASAVAPEIEATLQRSRGQGQPLGEAVRAPMEQAFRADFSGVRIHTDGESHELNQAVQAKAFTTGQNIYFRGGAYEPGSRSGQELLAHELTHVVQQSAAPLQVQAEKAPDENEQVIKDTNEVQRRREPSNIKQKLSETPTPLVQRDEFGETLNFDSLPGSPARVQLGGPYSDQAIAEELYGNSSVTVRHDPEDHTIVLVSGPRLLPQWRQHFSDASLRASVEVVDSSDSSTVYQQLINLREEILPLFQQALDSLDEDAVRASGAMVLATWQNIELSWNQHFQFYGSPIDPLAEHIEQHSYDEARNLVLTRVGTQAYNGNPVLGEYQPSRYEGDLGLFIYQQLDTVSWVIRDTRSAIDLLQQSEISEEQQWSVVGFLRQHQNPWHFAFMLAAIRDQGAQRALTRFREGPARGLRRLQESQRQIQELDIADPSQDLGILQLMPLDSKVKLIQPLSPQGLSRELYNSSAWENLLLPYNRSILQGASEDQWLPVGTEIVVDPDLLVDRFRGIFVGAVSGRQVSLDRNSDPYIYAQPNTPIVVGNEIHYGVSWPDSAFGDVRLQWSIENDPIAVQEEELPETVEGPSGLLSWGGESDATWDLRAVAPGTHTIKCRLTEESGETRVLTYLQTVMTLEQRTELEFRRHRSTLETPQELLERLRETSEDSRDEAQQEQLEETIHEIEEDLQEAANYSRMSQIPAVYVSSSEEPISIPLRIYVGIHPDNEPFGTSGHPYLSSLLKLWDFTLPRSRTYQAGAGESGDFSQALENLLARFADDAPYPPGNIRFRVPSSLSFMDLQADDSDITSSTSSEDFIPDGILGVPDRQTSTDVDRDITHPTDGGDLIDDVLRWLSTAFLAAGVVTAFVPGGQVVAVPALIVSGLLGGAAGAFSLADRLEHDDFEWDLQAGMDILDIAGALLTAGTLSTASAAVRGTGRVTMAARLSSAVDYTQIGIMAGVHLTEIREAVATGEEDAVVTAVASALSEGALFLIVHRASSRLGGHASETPDASGSRSRTAGGVAHGDTPATSGEGSRTSDTGTEGTRFVEPGTPEYHRLLHEGWTEQMLRGGLTPGQSEAPASTGEPLRAGTFRDGLQTPDAAYRAYDEALARANGREVGIFRNIETGEYCVRVGNEHSINPPVRGNWEGVLHYHPNPRNVLTYRMPAPADIEGTAIDAARAGQPITEFVEYPVPGVGRGRVAYTVTPPETAGGPLRIEIAFERPNGERVRRTYSSLGEYQRAWGERTRYVEPGSREYEWMMQDMDDFYGRSGRSEHASSSGRRTTGGSVTAASGETFERIPITEGDLQTNITDVVPGTTDYWEVNLTTEIDGDRVILATAGARLDSHGHPIESPSFIIETEHTLISGREIKLELQGSGGGRQSVTPFVLERVVQAYRTAFGAIPESLPASLERTNLLIFQREFAIAQDAHPNEGVQQISARAIMETSFARHRARLRISDGSRTYSYGDISISSLGDLTPVDLGEYTRRDGTTLSLGRRWVPRSVSADARRQQIP